MSNRYTQQLTGITDEHRSQMLAIYHDCFDRGEWKTKKTMESLNTMINRSAIMIVGAFDAQVSEEQDVVRDKLIGFAVVTGSSSDPLLEDILVDSQHRRGGVANLIIGSILTSLACSDPIPPHIELYCEWTLLTFYERFGFVKVRGEQGERCYMRRTFETEQ